MDQYTTEALGDWPRGLKVKKDEHPKRRPHSQDVGLVQTRSGRADHAGVKTARFESQDERKWADTCTVTVEHGVEH